MLAASVAAATIVNLSGLFIIDIDYPSFGVRKVTFWISIKIVLFGVDFLGLLTFGISCLTCGNY